LFKSRTIRRKHHGGDRFLPPLINCFLREDKTVAFAMYFMIIRGDPIYEAELPKENVPGEELAYLHQFILHSSLDLVKSAAENNSATYLKVVDRFNNAQVSAYITPGGTLFLLLHHGRSEDVVRNFFLEIHDLYTKHALNPLVRLDAPIVSPRFDALVQAAGRRL
jgi:hypothetical protein